MYRWPDDVTSPNNWFWPYQIDSQPDYTVWTNYWYNCPHCNNLIQWGYKFCPTCGKELTPKEEEPTLKSIQEKLEEIIRLLHSFDKTAREENG